jgi:hypothetical protein
MRRQDEATKREQDTAAIDRAKRRNVEGGGARRGGCSGPGDRRRAGQRVLRGVRWRATSCGGVLELVEGEGADCCAAAVVRAINMPRGLLPRSPNWLGDDTGQTTIKS